MIKDIEYYHALLCVLDTWVAIAISVSAVLLEIIKWIWPTQ